MPRPSLSALKTFEVVAHSGSLTAAAAILSVTQSAVSHQLRRLETVLDARLITRQGRGISLTPRGAQLAEELREGFTRIDAAVDTFVRQQSGSQLRIGCLPSVAVRWLIPRLNRFRRQHPGVSISLQYAGALEEHLPRDADVLITWQDAAPTVAAERLRLFSGATWPVASPLYLERAAPLATPGDLLNQELLHDESYRPWQQWFRHQGLMPPMIDTGVLYQDFNLLSAAAVAGQGVALCPPVLIENELAQGTLIRLFDAPANEERAYWLFYRPDPTAAMLAFRDWLAAEASALPAAAQEADAR
ncbi:LysR substrate-binding domain-containing protein [Halomonas denitrificans]|uniref:LysR substrate-binding domain-containing protein n=1 Tax=Halomonas denitrificans TaxID=370769 RepID=UPI001476164E|nr:LysR substrate-binding domain-containing protein [Halomonas denitrificans]